MAEPDCAYRAEAVPEDGRTADIRIELGTRSFLMLGPAGLERETGMAAALPQTGPDQREQNFLPVILGSGLGHGLSAVIARLRASYGEEFRLAVVDKEEAILALTGLRDQMPGNVRWVDASQSRAARKELADWQKAEGGKPFVPLVNTAYLRLDRDYYRALSDFLSSAAPASRTRPPRFMGKLPRVLMLTSKYFLMGEFTAGCRRLGVPHHLIQMPSEGMSRDEFVRTIVRAVTEFKPDFVFTINHLGVDREGLLMEILERTKLPLASWFVDNPHLLLEHYNRMVSERCVIFTWDRDNLPSLRKLGFDKVFYLPLGTDEARFTPTPRMACPEHWKAPVAFVGNSMRIKIQQRIARLRLPAALMENIRDLATGFAATEERSVRAFLARVRPDLLPAFDALPDIEHKLGFETALIWEATLAYRLSCVKAVLPYRPLVLGDPGWMELLGEPGDTWLYNAEISYYDQLPAFYTCPDINLNCTSRQMKGAVNQRVFDVPATRSFLLTDWQEQIADLFEPGREVICFRSPEEAHELTGRFLADPAARKRVSGAAYRRVLAEHTYSHRIRSLLDTVRQSFA